MPSAAPVEFGSAPISAKALSSALAPEEWLGPTTEAFTALANATPPVSRTDIRRFFARRKLGLEPALARALVALDARTIAHGLSLLLSGKGQDIALQPLPERVFSALRDDPPLLDHIGIEVFGRLEWYIEMLRQWTAPGVMRLGDYRVFPSVQVRKALAYDPGLEDVRIARVYVEGGGRDVNLELFEVTQHWLYTVPRRWSLFAGAGRGGQAEFSAALKGSVPVPLDPVDHLALRVNNWETVRTVHAILSGLGTQDADTRLYDTGLSYNHGDGSLNCKFLTRSATFEGSPVFGRVTELISYGIGNNPMDNAGSGPAPSA